MNLGQRNKPPLERCFHLMLLFPVFTLITCNNPNLEFPTGLKMETVSLQRAFRAGSEDEGLLPRLQSLGEHGPRTVHGPRLVWLYCVIEDVVRQILGETRLRSRGPTPELTDVESLTIEIFGETLGLNSDASIWRRPPAGLVSRPRDRVELRQALRQPVLAERSGRRVPSLQGLERLLPLPVCKYARSRRGKRVRGGGPAAPPSRGRNKGSRGVVRRA